MTMKKTLLTTAVLFAMGSTSAVLAGADDIYVDVDGSYTDLENSQANASGEGASAHVVVEDAANMESSNSFNPTLLGSVNDINSDNTVSIGEDGNVLYANNADQAIATSDLDATISGNEVAIGSAINDTSALSPVTNTQAGNAYSATNAMTDSFSGAAGIAVVSQNTGHSSSIQQSVVVQSNFSLN